MCVTVNNLTVRVRVNQSIFQNVQLCLVLFVSVVFPSYVRVSIVCRRRGVQCCVYRPASSRRLHSCITFHLSSLLDRVSAASTFSRAGPGAMPRGQQLMGLRKALYRALRSAFRASRRATCHMLKAYPSYICGYCLSAFVLILTKDLEVSRIPKA